MTTPSHTPGTVPDADPLTAAREALRRGDLHAGKHDRSAEGWHEFVMVPEPPKPGEVGT